MTQIKFQEKYVPKTLSTKDKKQQVKELTKSVKNYKKKKYHTRKKVDSFTSKPSKHVEKAMKIYEIKNVKPNNELAKKTGCSKKGLNLIIKKGMGAYYSSGSRPNQTAHSWGIARLASAITGGPSSKVDYHLLKEHCKKNSKALQMADKLVQKAGSLRYRTKDKTIHFRDYPDFIPNLTPREIIKLGSFGGTYWRPIYSTVTKKRYKNIHKQYPKSWWKNIPENHLSRPWKDYDKTINKYKVKVGTTLEFWEDKNWISKHHPYGWYHWYCDFYNGKRSPDDERQISRWKKTAGPKSRFRRALINEIIRKESKYNDFTISPKKRQTLQHWGYKLTKKDCK